MQSSLLEKGRNYAWSAKPRDADVALEKVRFLGTVKSGKARMRWESGELTGLEECISTRQLVCAWKDRKAWQRDEQRRAALDADSDQLWDRVVENAISHVLTATGEEGGFQHRWTLTPEKAVRLWRRAGLEDDPRQEQLAFIDRHGLLHLGYRSALRFAKAFAAAEPDACVQLVDHWESELNAEGHLPGNSWHHDYLREERPAHALVRQWAGSAEVTLLRKELQRLQGLVGRAEGWLRDAGDDRHATQLSRALHGK